LRNDSCQSNAECQNGYCAKNNFTQDAQMICCSDDNFEEAILPGNQSSPEFHCTGQDDFDPCASDSICSSGVCINGLCDSEKGRYFATSYFPII